MVNILKQFVGKLPTNCLSVFDLFMGLALKRLDHKSEKVHGEKVWPIVMKYERKLCEGVDSDSIKNFHSEVFCINWKTPAI